MASQGGRAIGLLIARVCFAALFITTGAMSLPHVGQTAGQLASHGYPVPRVMAIVAVAAQLCGGLSLLAGMLTPLGCIALILFLLPTTYSFHLPGLLAGDVRQTIDTLKNLAIIGGLIALLFTGPGPFSFDGRIMTGGGKR